MSAKYCLSCGSKLMPLAKFCGQCGTPSSGVAKAPASQSSRPTSRVRLASELRGKANNHDNNDEYEDDGDEGGSDVDSVPQISKLEINISNDGNLNEQGYGARRFKGSDLFNQ